MANTSQDNIQLRVIIDGSPARKELAQVNQDLVKLKETQKQLVAEQRALNDARRAAKANGDTAEVQRLNKAMEQNRQQLGETTKAVADHTARQTALRQQIGDTALSFSELRGKALGMQQALARAVPNTPEARKLAADLFMLQQRMKEVGGQAGIQAQAWEHLRKGLKLTDMTMRQLELESARLKTALEKTNPNSREFTALHTEMGRVDTRMRTLRTGMGPFGQAWAAVKSQIMGATAILGTFLAGGAIFNLMGGMVKSSAELSDAIADVRRTTGLTTEQVKGMVEQFKNLDTRTPRAELMALAADAGKLGLSAEQDVMAFVRAGDQLRVALGEELGDDAIKNIGKLVDLFRLKEQFGLEQSMLKVGSTLNELGMSSTAAEGYMVEFLKRMGGIAPLAGITIDQTLALGATLDSLGQTSEVSSTALSKMFVKMASEADQYARLAGMSTEKFRDVMSKNALDAFIAVLEGSKKTEGGIIALTETLGEMGVDGSRAAGVFGALANNTDVLAKQLQIAAGAFQEGTSVTDEFRIKNETLAASLAKLQKEIMQTFITTGVADMVKEWVAQLRELLAWLRRNAEVFRVFGQVLLTVGTALAAYKATVLATTVATRAGMAITTAWTTLQGLLTGQIRLATAAQQAFNTVTKLNPIGLVVAALAAALPLLNRYSAATKAAADAASNETTKLQILHSQILATNKGSAERRKLIEELKAQYPEYLGQLDSDKATNEELAKSIKQVNDMLIQKAALSVADSELEEQNARAAKAKLRQIDAERELQELLALGYKQTGLAVKEGTLAQQAMYLQTMGLSKGMSNSVYNDLRAAMLRVQAWEGEFRAENEKSNILLEKRTQLMRELTGATDTTATTSERAVRSLQQVTEEINQIQFNLANPGNASTFTVQYWNQRLQELKAEQAALIAAGEGNAESARTLAVINAEIKRWQEQQEATSTNSAEYNDIQRKIDALEREKAAIEGTKGARKSAAEDLSAIERAMAEFHERMFQDTLAEDEKALRQLDVRHAEELAKLQEHQKKLTAANKLTPQQAATNVDTLEQAQARERTALLEQQAQNRWRIMKEANDRIQQQLGESHNKQLQMEVEHWEAVVAAQAEGGGKSRNRDGVTRMWGAGPNIEDIKRLHAARLALYTQNAQDLLAQETTVWDDLINEAKLNLQEYEDAMAATGLPYSDEVQAEVQAQHQAIVDLEARKNQAIENINRAHRDHERAERQKESLAIRQEYARRVQSVANWADAVGSIMASLLQVRDAEIAAAEQRADADGERTAAEIAGIEQLKEARKRAALTHIKVQMAAAMASGVASVMASPIPWPGNLLAAAGAVATIIGLFAQARSLLNDSGGTPSSQQPGAGNRPSLNNIPLGDSGLKAKGGKVVRAKDGGSVLSGQYHSNGGNLLIDSQTGRPLAEVERDELMLILSRKATAANADLIPMMLEASRRGERMSFMQRELPMPNPTKVGQAMRVVHMAGGGTSDGLNGSFNLAEKGMMANDLGAASAMRGMGPEAITLLQMILEEQRATRRATESFPTEITATTSIREGERRKLEYDHIQRLNKGRSVWVRGYDHRA